MYLSILPHVPVPPTRPKTPVQRHGSLPVETDDFANAIIQHDASFSGPEGIQYGQYVWEPTTVGKIDFLENV